MSIADYLVGGDRSDLEIAKSRLERKPSREKADGQVKVRSNLEGRPNFEPPEIVEYQGEAIVSVGTTKGDQYKVGELVPALIGKKLDFHWDEPEPIYS